MRILSFEIKVIDNSQYYIGRTDWDKNVVKSLNYNSVYFVCEEILRKPFYENNIKLDFKIYDELNLISVTDSKLYKDFYTLAIAAKILDTLNIKYRWQILGLNKADNIVKIFRYKTKGNISKNLIFNGKVGAESLINYLVSSDIFINTSHIENSCNAIQEDMI